MEKKVLKINELNWTFCQFKHEDCFAAIHQGGDMTPDGEFVDVFYVNILKIDSEFDEQTHAAYKEIHQEVFPHIADALEYINSHFSHWKFVNLLEEHNEKSSGCGSCVAH